MSRQLKILSVPASSPLAPFAPFLQLHIGLILLLLLGVIALSVFSKRKGKLVAGRVAGKKERLKALSTAQTQMKRRKHNKVTLYIGTPRYSGWKAKVGMALSNTPSTIYVPNAQEGIIVCGSPGKGKTYGVIDRLIWSSLDQGLPTVVWDLKGDQLKTHAAYAAALGYQVYVFAPGKPYSDVLNPLDFIKDEGDRSMSKQFASVLNRNLKDKPGGSSDEYFTQAADLLLQAILLLAKGSCYDDLLMVWAIVSLPQLAKRLDNAKNEGNLAIWASIGARALSSVAHAQETEGGIISNAINAFADLISRDFIPSLCGRTTMPLDLKGKQLVVFQTDPECQDAVSPIVATMLHLLVVRNMSHPRTEPFVLAMDELAQGYFPDLKKWVNVYRSNGFCPILGFQNFAQLEERYGREATTAIMGAIASKFIFNPQDGATARAYSDYFGEEEVILKTRSRSSGKSSGTSTSEQYHKKPLFDSRYILTMPFGKCIFINPAYESRGEAALPQAIKIKVPKKDIKIQERSERLWDEKVLHLLIERARRQSSSSLETFNEDALKQQLLDREKIAEMIFPSPDVKEESFLPESELFGEAPESFR